jgi:hypothetical protein
MTDVRPSLAPALATFGLLATVTLPGEAPVATTAIWLPPVSVETVGVVVATDRPQRVLSLPRAGLPFLPTDDLSRALRGTTIEVADVYAGPVRVWTVEAVAAEAVDEIRVSVIPGASP